MSLCLYRVLLGVAECLDPSKSAIYYGGSRNTPSSGSVRSYIIRFDSSNNSYPCNLSRYERLHSSYDATSGNASFTVLMAKSVESRQLRVVPAMRAINQWPCFRAGTPGLD